MNPNPRISGALSEGVKAVGNVVNFIAAGLSHALPHPMHLLIRIPPFLPDKRFLFPDGVKAVGDAVDLIASGEAPRIVQPTEGATYDPLWKVSASSYSQC